MGAAPASTGRLTVHAGRECADARRDVSLATALGRELNVPMRLANLALADLSEGLNRGWGHRDSRSMMILQTERAGVEIKVDPQRLTEAMQKKAKTA